MKDLKVALVTDWLTNLGGGEKVVKAISDLFPDAPIFTTVVNKENIGKLAEKEIKTSFLQQIPYFNKKHQFLLPLLPTAVESLNLNDYDLVLSFSASVAKSVLTNPEQTHICYIHSPMRYAWEPFFDNRFAEIPKLFSPFINRLLHKLRLWDKASATRADLFIANSTTTQKRVEKYYRRNSKVLYPPVSADCFKISKNKEDFYLGVGRMVTYKKFDLLVNTFKHLPEKKLKLIGDGPELKKLKRIAKNCPNIEFIPKTSFKELTESYSKAKAFLLPQKEDAGIVQLEAMAAGTPVIAYKAGGALDVITHEKNGYFFEKQEEDSLKDAILEFEKLSWDAEEIRDSILEYDLKEFQKNYLKIVENFLQNKKLELGE